MSHPLGKSLVRIVKRNVQLKKVDSHVPRLAVNMLQRSNSSTLSSKSGIHNIASKPEEAMQLEQIAVPDLKKFGENGVEFRGLDTDFPCLMKQ